MKQNQFREHLHFKFIHSLRQLYWRRKIGYLGLNVYIDKNVKILRYLKNIQLENNVVLKEGTRICSCNYKAEIHIGKNTTIGYHNFIFASDKILIGSDCLIAPFVYIVDSNHQFHRNQNINEQKNVTEPIIIGDDVWIASNVTILKGTIIKKGAVIAANSVVNGIVPEYNIYGGTPAKKIGERK